MTKTNQSNHQKEQFAKASNSAQQLRDDLRTLWTDATPAELILLTDWNHCPSNPT